MAPTICSGKKRQTRSIATTNIQRHGQGPQQLNQALSNIVNFIAKDSINPRAFASLRTQNYNQTKRNINTTGLNYNHMTGQTEAASESYYRSQQISIESDNEISDTENSLDLRLSNEILTNDSTATYSSNITPSSLSSDTSTSSPHKEKTSSQITQCQQRIFKKFATAMNSNKMLSNGKNDSDDGETVVSTKMEECDSNDKLSWYKTTNKIHSSSSSSSSSNSIKKHYFSCNAYDTDDDELVYAKDLNSDDMSGMGSEADIDTDESDSMTSLDTEKSAELKRANHPLLRERIFAAQKTKNNSTKSTNTDGLLSIAIKTIKLVKRNQLLQQRLTQLQLETSEFIQSVMANPENLHYRENIKQKVQKVDNA